MAVMAHAAVRPKPLEDDAEGQSQLMVVFKRRHMSLVDENTCAKSNTGMGLVDLNTLSLDCGLQLANCYVSVTPNAPTFPFAAEPVSFQWTYDGTGNRTYTRMVTVFVYSSKAAKDAGSTPLQSRRIALPAGDAASVLSSIYAELRQSLYTNTSGDDGVDELNIVPAPPS